MQKLDAQNECHFCGDGHSQGGLCDEHKFIQTLRENVLISIALYNSYDRCECERIRTRVRDELEKPSQQLREMSALLIDYRITEIINDILKETREDERQAKLTGDLQRVGVNDAPCSDGSS